MQLEATLREKQCATCGQTFKPKSARQKYCSDLCKRGVSTCVNCGKEFVRKGNTTGNFCSSECWYAWPGRIEDKECPVCHKLFRPKNNKQKTCSYECADKSRQTAVRRTHCEHCGKPLKPNVHPKVRFCSKSCGLKSRNRKGQKKAVKETRRNHSTGYMLVKVGKDYPGAMSNGWILEHRYVMEQHLGRQLEAHEHIHHKNGDRHDNRLENLELWTVAKKDPPGQRQMDRAKDLVLKMSNDERVAFFAWLQDLLAEIVIEP